MTVLESGDHCWRTYGYRVELNEAEREQPTANAGAAANMRCASSNVPRSWGPPRLGSATRRSRAAFRSAHRQGVQWTKRRFVEGNLELALSEETRPGVPRKLSGMETALLVATACSSPPQGRKRWTLIFWLARWSAHGA